MVGVEKEVNHLFLPYFAADTVVRFKTVLGDFDVQLYETTSLSAAAELKLHLHNFHFGVRR